jgi:EmrB/QacA subfamily drug resistance transporter
MDIRASKSAGDKGVRMSSAQRWVLVASIVASSMVFIDGTALNVALPSLQADLGADAAELLWIVNSYLLMLASLILVGGSLGDKLGRKRVFMFGIALFMAASLACGLAPTSSVLIVCRAMQGVGGALMIPGSLAIIAAEFDESIRGRAYGTWAATTTIVTVGGPVLGGILADAGLWRGVFLINLPLALLALVILKTRVSESRDEEAPAGIDYPGALLATVGLGAMTYGFIRAPDVGFSDPLVVVSLTVGLIALLLFVYTEFHSRHAMMPPELFRSRTFSGVNLLTLFLYGGLSVAIFFLALNLIQIQDYSPTAAGLAFTPFALVLAFVSPFAGRLTDRYGARFMLVIGPSLAGLGMLIMGNIGLSSGPSEYWTTFFPAVVMIGFGMGLTVAPLTTAVMGSVASHFAGTASGVNNSISRIAGVMSVAILGSAFLFSYSNVIEDQIDGFGLSDSVREMVLAEADKLGEAEVPDGVNPDMADEIDVAFSLAFVDSFSLLMYVSAVMAWASALVAFLMVEKKQRLTTST